MLGMLVAGTFLQAQINTPQPSPLSTVTQKVGLTDVTISYSRPGAKQRKVFGDLVPFDKLWRTGANKATKISLSDSVTINKVKLPKGDYSLLTIPGQKEWTIILNKDAELSGTSGYDQSKDVTRFTVPSSTAPFTETFTINFANLTGTSADVEISWETTKVSFTVDANPDSKVMKSIQSSLTVPPFNYYQAARYYYDTNRDMKQALEWINKSIDNGFETFWVLRQKSLIQAKLGDYAGAVATAERSLELAKKDGNDDYVKMNTESIAEWKSKK